MILFILLAVLVGGGLLAWATAGASDRLSRAVAAGAIGVDLLLVLTIWIFGADGLRNLEAPARLLELDWAWIPRFGVRFHLALDGLSLVFVALTMFLGLLAVLASAAEVRGRTGFFHFNLLAVLAGLVGVFLAADLFLFYFFWELMLVPMVVLIGVWGHERRVAAAVKFFLFTQAGGLAMLVAILALHASCARTTGLTTFDAAALLATPLGSAAPWIMLGFLAAFLVKAPGVPFHTWLPDAHAQAPTAGSVVLAGLLLKTGAYGLIRFALPLAPPTLRTFAPYGMAIGVAGIIYGAKLAFAQSDLKRLVAYTSVSHMGFVLLGIFALDPTALQGAVLQVVCHGVSTGALFILAGVVQQRLGTRDLGALGGLWASMPRLGAAGMFFALAALGLPGLGNFVAEFLVLAGAFRTAPVFAVLGSLGLVASTVYALSLIQRLFHGPRTGPAPASDLGRREVAIFAAAALVLVWLGLYPQPVLDISRKAVDATLDRALSGRQIEPTAGVSTTGPERESKLRTTGQEVLLAVDPAPSAGKTRGRG